LSFTHHAEVAALVNDKELAGGAERLLDWAGRRCPPGCG
jgi:hypothetical protein